MLQSGGQKNCFLDGVMLTLKAEGLRHSTNRPENRQSFVQPRGANFGVFGFVEGSEIPFRRVAKPRPKIKRPLDSRSSDTVSRATFRDAAVPGR